MTNHGTVYGYARVSTGEQDTAPQRAALEVAGVTRVIEETASGGRWDRPALQGLLAALTPGDTLVVWKLDRLSRSLSDLLAILAKVQGAGAAFRSLTEAVDTSTAAGRMVAQMIGAFAEFERGIIVERTKRGLEHARKRGRIGGRPRSLNREQAAEVVSRVNAAEWTQADAARMFRVHPATVGRLLKRAS